MQKLLGVAVVAVLATAAMNVVLFRRQQDLATQVTALRRQVEERPASSDAAVRTSAPEESRVAEPERRMDGVVPAGGSDRVSGAGGFDASGLQGTSAPSGTSGTETAVAQLSEAQKAAIAQEVDRIMKDRDPGIKIMRPAEQLAFLAKELNLSETQKLRIKDVWRMRDQEVRKLMEASEGFPGPKKFNELQERFHALVRQELDSAQQLKFDEMKKDGVLPTGDVSIRVEHRDSSEEPPK